MSTPDARNPALAAWLALARTQQRCNRAFADRLRPLGITVPQHEVLVRLLYEDGQAQKALSERLIVTKGSLSTLVSRLEASGLVERRADATDGRVVRVWLTDRGRELATRGYAVQEAYVADIMSPLSPDDLDAITRALRSIERGIRGNGPDA